MDNHVENVDFPGEIHMGYSETAGGLYRENEGMVFKFYKNAQSLLVWKHFFCYTENMDNRETCAVMYARE